VLRDRDGVHEHLPAAAAQLLFGHELAAVAGHSEAAVAGNQIQGEARPSPGRSTRKLWQVKATRSCGTIMSCSGSWAARKRTWPRCVARTLTGQTKPISYARMKTGTSGDDSISVTPWRRFSSAVPATGYLIPSDRPMEGIRPRQSVHSASALGGRLRRVAAQLPLRVGGASQDVRLSRTVRAGSARPWQQGRCSCVREKGQGPGSVFGGVRAEGSCIWWTCPGADESARGTPCCERMKGDHSCTTIQFICWSRCFIFWTG
jgi:hypothetical protein